MHSIGKDAQKVMLDYCMLSTLHTVASIDRKMCRVVNEYFFSILRHIETPIISLAKFVSQNITDELSEIDKIKKYFFLIQQVSQVAKTAFWLQQHLPGWQKEPEKNWEDPFDNEKKIVSCDKEVTLKTLWREYKKAITFFCSIHNQVECNGEARYPRAEVIFYICSSLTKMPLTRHVASVRFLLQSAGLLSVEARTHMFSYLYHSDMSMSKEAKKAVYAMKCIVLASGKITNTKRAINLQLQESAITGDKKMIRLLLTALHNVDDTFYIID